MKYFAICFSILTLQLFGQNNLDELSLKFYADIEKKYFQSEVLTYQYNVTQYDSSGTTKVKEMTGSIFQSKSKFSYDLDDIKVVFEDSFYLLVYKNKKEMYYHILSDSLVQQNQNLDITKFVKQLRSNNVRVEKDSCRSDQYDCYNLVYGSLDKNLYKIRVNKKTGYIEYLRIDYYGSSDQMTVANYIIEINYSNYRKLESRQFFPLKEFIVKNNGELQPNERYKEFQITKF